MSVPDQLLAPLNRQRRFLILMSLAIVAYFALGAHFKDEASYSPFALALARPSLAIWGVWIVWGWALVRYGQRFYELLSVLRDEIRSDIDAEDRRMALRVAANFAVKAAKAGSIGRLQQSDVTVDESTVNIQPTLASDVANEAGLAAPSVQPDFLPLANGGRRYPRIGGAYTFRGEGGARGSSSFVMPLEFSPGRTLWHRRLARVHALWRLPAVTDFVAPFAIAAAAPAAPFATALFARLSVGQCPMLS